MGSRDYTLDLWQTLAKQFGVPELTARHLAEKYGSCASDVLELAENGARSCASAA